jgi:hypothetical protein
MQQLAYAIDHMDKTQLHLAKVGVEWAARERTGLSRSLLDPGRPPVVALGSRTEREHAYAAEIMPQPKDGKMEEERQRQVNAPRKPPKVSFCEVEEEKTREVVDEMTWRPDLYSESGTGTSRGRAACKHTKQELLYTSGPSIGPIPFQEKMYQAERTGDGLRGTAKSILKAGVQISYPRGDASKTLATAEKQSDRS